jgi:DMSO/TMAO reductase YedYZ molybdopterin-dependent catalytic subunit
MRAPHRPPRMLALWLAAALLVAACAPAATPTAAPTQPPPPPTAAPTAAPPILTVSGPSGSQELTWADLQALPLTEGYAGIKSSTGKITLPATYRGVSLAHLAEVVGGLAPGNGVNLVAKDGYAMTYSEDQVLNGAFIAYDPATGEELKSPPALTAILAYEIDGQPITDEEGPLRVAIVSDEGNQVTDGHWSVKWVTAAELKELVQDWTLELTGGLSDSIDRASFESCSAPQCHGASWTDDQGQVWSGVPLWLLVGSVDDAVQHEGPAFNDDLAAAGYTITVTASDGYSTELESAAVARNPDILVAHLVDGQPLPEKYFPLRLVSSALAKNQLVGMISQIALSLEPVPTTAPAEAAAPSGEVVLTIDGPGDAMTEFTDAELRALGVVTKTLEHPKKGATQYEGVPLLAVLKAAGVTDAVATLELEAGDGYSAELPAAEVLACADCLLTFGETPGEYALAMPGLPSNAWVKGIARIEAK